MNEKSNSDVQPHHRKLKKILNKVKQQMEFYFSDSNLVKDKFLTDLISKDPDGFVDLEVFKKFNKIKALTNSCEVIASSLTRSNMFQVSEDHKKVRRVTPIELSKDFDACTLYVEKLPQYADQNWIKDVLGHFGCIKYVNVPRYKATKKIKGFAFVEFESPDGVKNACEFYKISSEKECSASEDDSKNIKNARKHKLEETSEKKNKKSRIRSVSESSDKFTDFSSLKSDQHQEASDKDLDHDKGHLHQKGKRKRKRGDTVSEVIAKKPKESDKELNILSAKYNNAFKEKESGIKTENVSVQRNDQVTTDEETMTVISSSERNGTTVKESKSKRKRKNSKKHRSNTEKTVLRVMPKSEWKTFRNKYLELQRSTMSLIKKQIMLEMQEFKEQEGHVKPVDVSETKKSLQFLPGVILKVQLTEPIKNSSEIKNQIKANAVVAYVDAPLESREIFIRCHSSEEAQTIIKEEKLSNLGKPELIQGDEEKKYWEKIQADRKNKYDNPVPHKKRGRDKILAKAAKLEEVKNKHIYFDE